MLSSQSREFHKFLLAINCCSYNTYGFCKIIFSEISYLCITNLDNNTLSLIILYFCCCSTGLPNLEKTLMTTKKILKYDVLLQGSKNLRNQIEKVSSLYVSVQDCKPFEEFAILTIKIFSDFQIFFFDLERNCLQPSMQITGTYGVSRKIEKRFNQ